MHIARVVLVAGVCLNLGCGDDGGGGADGGPDAAACVPMLGRVAENAGGGDRVAIARAGAGFGVVWSDGRHGDSELYFARLDDAGKKVGADVRLTNAAGSSGVPAIVWNGSEFAVAFSDTRDGAEPEIYFVRATDGGPVAGSERRVTNAPTPSLGASVVWTGSEYGLAWHDFRDGDPEIYFTRLDASGAKIGNDIRLTNTVGQSFRPSLVWTGSSFAVSWNDDTSGDPEIYLLRLSPAGEKLGMTRVSNAAGQSLFSSLAWTGSGFGVVWNDNRVPAGVYFARLDASGNLMGTETLIIAGAGVGGQRSLGWTGSEFAVASEEVRDGNYEVFLVRLDATGAPRAAPLRITNAAGDSLESAVAPAAAGIGVAWIDQREGAPAPYAGLACW